MTTGKIILFSVLGLGTIGGIAYAIDRKRKKQKPPADSLKQYPCGVANDGGTATPFKLYKVTTLLTDLNIRQGPGINTTKVGSVHKGDKIYARPSCFDAWYEYSIDGKVRSGYVYANYLTLV